MEKLFRALDKVSLLLKINLLIKLVCGPFLVQKRGGKSPGHISEGEANGNVLLDGVVFS